MLPISIPWPLQRLDSTPPVAIVGKQSHHWAMNHKSARTQDYVLIRTVKAFSFFIYVKRNIAAIGILVNSVFLLVTENKLENLSESQGPFSIS